MIPREAKFVTIYLDNMWTHPVSHTMRADIGWELRPQMALPDGMARFDLPAGLYVESSRYVRRNERNDAWSYFSGRWSCHSSAALGFDEYEAWPLPFEKVMTRLVVGPHQAVK